MREIDHFDQGNTRCITIIDHQQTASTQPEMGLGGVVVSERLELAETREGGVTVSHTARSGFGWCSIRGEIGAG